MPRAPTTSAEFSERSQEKGGEREGKSKKRSFLEGVLEMGGE